MFIELVIIADIKNKQLRNIRLPFNVPTTEFKRNNNINNNM